MNVLFLGTDLPDYNNPILKKFNQPAADESNLTEMEKTMRAIQSLGSSDYLSTKEKMMSHYRDRLFLIQAAFNQYLSDYGVFNLPSAGLAAWIRFHKPMDVTTVLADLEEIGIYIPKADETFEINEPIAGIRAGFGTHDSEIYDLAFKRLAKHFRA